jgi:hypothetical protein
VFFFAGLRLGYFLRRGLAPIEPVCSVREIADELLFADVVYPTDASSTLAAMNLKM